MCIISPHVYICGPVPKVLINHKQSSNWVSEQSVQNNKVSAFVSKY